MNPSDEPRQPTARTVGRILARALADAARGELRIEPGTQVWIKVEAPERLRLRRLSDWVWREGLVIQWINNRKSYLVHLLYDDGLSFLAGPTRVRRAPPWQIEEGVLGP